jgi:hypothetical protein
MRFKVIVLALVALFATGSLATAQQQTGEIFGKVSDTSGAVLPGVTVTLSAPNLLQPLTAITSETGTYQFPRLEIGSYTVKFELTGFKTVINQDIKVTVGFSAQVNGALAISTVQETITVTGESPVVDTKEVGTKQTFTNELLQSIPSARDPWVILQQTAGIAMDRENIGGNMSGQQSNFVSRGGNPTNNKWSLDGVDITDLSATGSSPTYYDFDMFEEMTVNTGGVDVTQQTGGVGINLVTKAGSDRFRGSSRFYDTNKALESNNIDSSLRSQGASSGNPIQDIKDYGIEVGGPIKKGRAWIWGAFGKQSIDVGVVGFYLPTANCQAYKNTATALAASVSDVNDCLNTDETVLKTTNLKAEVQLFKGNKLSIYSLFSAKQRNARNASDLTPIESTVVQAAVPATYGTNLWVTGPTPTYKFGDQYVLSDRFLVDVQYAHVGNNFILDYHDPSYATQTPAAGIIGLQPYLIVSTGANGRSTPDNSQSVNIRPSNSLTVNTNYFLPGKLGGDHAFKIGGYWRDNNGFGSTHTPGNAVARFPTATDLAAVGTTDCGTILAGCQTNVTRDAQTDYDLTNISLYGQDTFTRGRMTLQLGLRYDYNHDQALASSVVANYLLPAVLPAVSFAGVDPGVKFNNLSPRIGFSYNLDGSGKTVFHGNYATYWGQVGVGGVSSFINPVSRVSVRYNWVDANHDGFVQNSEIYDTKGVQMINGGNPANFAALTGNWNPAAPGSPTSPNSVDPNLKNDRTDEIIFGADHEVGLGFAVGANYIWRRYTNFQFVDTTGLAASDYTAVSYTPTASSCPSADGLRIGPGNCPTITYYQPNFQTPTAQVLTNYSSSDFNRAYNGLELSARKRLSHHWLMNTSFAYNSTIVNIGDSFAGVPSPGNTLSEDPTNRTTRNGFQYDYASAGSGLGNVYINAKWLYKLSGLYNLPGDFNVSAFFNARQGYPEEFAIQTPSRANGAGIATVLLNGVGDTRLPNYANLDFHVDRPLKLGSVRVLPAIDIFNVFNNNIIQGVRTTQNAANANQIQAITAPRVARVGLKVTW